MTIDFTPENLSILKEFQRGTKDIAVYQKLLMLVMLHKGLTQEETAFFLCVDRTTVNRNFHSFLESKDLDGYLGTKYTPRSSKLTEAQEAELRSYVSGHLCATSLEIRDWLVEKFGVCYTESGAIAMLNRLGFTFKKTKQVPSKASVPKQQEFVEYFRELEKNLTNNELILFADGVHPLHNTEPSYAWCEKGKEKEIFANTGRVRVNINGAINPLDPTEVVAFECKTINAETNVAFLKEIEKRFADKKTIYLIVDNARYNHAKVVREYLVTSRIKMVYLPAYSPNLNPIERLWKFMKKTVIKSSYTPDPKVFRERVIEFFDKIGDYKSKLVTLINTNFHIINPNMEMLQT